MNNTLVIDTETTGLNKTDKILSLSGIVLDDDLNQISEFNEFLNWLEIDPNFTISQESSAINKITLDNIRSHDGPIKVFKKFNDFLDTFNCKVVVGHNLPYDLSMIKSNLNYLKSFSNDNNNKDSLDVIDTLNEYFNSNNVYFIDTRTIDVMFDYERNGVRNKHDQESVYRRLVNESYSEIHNSLDDAKHLIEIYKYQYNTLNMKDKAIFDSLYNAIMYKYRVISNKDYFGN